MADELRIVIAQEMSALDPAMVKCATSAVRIVPETHGQLVFNLT